MLKLVATEHILSAEDAQKEIWDVVIVGTGMGGGMTARTLTKLGLNVLAIDKGAANYDGEGQNVAVEPKNTKELYENGRWPTQLRTSINGEDCDMWAPIGCGFGGSSLLYAAALQRLRQSDFKERTTPLGKSLSWPLSYQEFEPYYQQAEKIFGVRGSEDPLEKEPTYNLLPPPAMCEQDQSLFESFKQAGYHPFRLHVGYQYEKGCDECGGQLCIQNCKRDAYNSCIVPALKTGKLKILEYSEVTRLVADNKKVSNIELIQNGAKFELKAKRFVLGAGAFFTPILLFKSKSDVWPNGLANKNGLVGKNLMFHACDFLGIWPERKCSRDGPNKNIAVRDHYEHDGIRLGELQSTGMTTDFGLVLYSLRLLFDQTKFRRFPPLRHLLRIPAWIASKLYGHATVFTTNVEDYPYPENRVMEDDSAPSGMKFEYTVHPELKERVELMRGLLRKRLKNLRVFAMNLTVNINYGHPCGTCKMGSDPSDSVVDENCKAHDLENLYIVDASFMPTSGGTNPSLTIAANAIRVAEAIHKGIVEENVIAKT